ncbi:MAG: zinc-binding dehydrogenase [Gemmatimonadaceae bacterium]|nr:zinc-binding dehydrogenase [Gemmatimonadaceae bacterium]
METDAQSAPGERMRAVVIAADAPGTVVVRDDVPTPAAEPSLVRVRVHAAGLNRADLLQVAGRYPPPPGAPPDRPGLEFAGIALDDAPQAGLERGMRVCGLVPGGAQSDVVRADPRTLLPVSGAMSWDEAGAFPEAALTAFDALGRRAPIAAGDTVLIHAIASGVGLAAAQYARALGARVLGTTRTAAKAEQVSAMGLGEVHVTRDGLGGLEAFVRDRSADGATHVLDLVGGAYVAATLPSLALRGHYVVLATLGGADVSVPGRFLLARRLTLHGSVLRSRSVDEHAELASDARARLLPHVRPDAVWPVLDATFPLDAAPAAYARLASDATLGKVVLRLGEE